MSQYKEGILIGIFLCFFGLGSIVAAFYVFIKRIDEDEELKFFQSQAAGDNDFAIQNQIIERLKRENAQLKKTLIELQKNPKTHGLEDADRQKDKFYINGDKVVYGEQITF